jgi:hypothetical protein
LDTGLDFSRDIDEVEIVVTAKPAQVSGVVTDEHGAPLPRRPRCTHRW